MCNKKGVKKEENKGARNGLLNGKKEKNLNLCRFEPTPALSIVSMKHMI